MIINRTSRRSKRYLSSAIFFTSCLFLTISNIIASDDAIVINLSLKQKALYVTSCDFDGNGLEDIIAADEKDITVFLQQPNLSFKSYYFQSREKIIALNSFRTGTATQKNIVCIGQNRLFYLTWGHNEAIQGPNYIKILDLQERLLEKQKNMKNFAFVCDLNNDTLDDMIIPANDGPLIIWQIEPFIFKTQRVNLENNFVTTNMNISPWPKFGNRNQKLTAGFSFFPTSSRKMNYWFQDYNNDKLLDIINISESTNAPEISVILQQKDMVFATPQRLKFQRNNYQRSDTIDLQFFDLNNDGLLEIIETEIENPLTNNDSLMPLIIIKTYYPIGRYNFNTTPQNLFKSVFMPGLNNIMDLDNDGVYEIITATSPLKLSSKESIIKATINKELAFILRYFKTKGVEVKQNIVLNKEFSIFLPDLNNIDNFKQFIRLEDVNGDNIHDVLILKKSNVLEIDLLKRIKGLLSINSTLEIALPYPLAEMELVDIDSDGRKEFITIDSSRKLLSVIKYKGI